MCYYTHTNADGDGTVETIKGIKVGVSTFDDVKRILAPEEVDYYWYTIDGNMRFLGSRDVDHWSIVQACFVNNQLSAMHILGAVEFQKSITEFIELYGNTDIVTWGNWFYERSLLWAEKGLLIVVVGTLNKDKTRIYESIFFTHPAL